ncbi:mechanosensitive ion channel protein [Thalassotalea insulae]|uniref:Small-conductance mechanosensitive channel n=1 Tax=Thalassotalea insulae TaxID=2056778 RepID=A0ABQ6GSI1_9GAMM|nr:mechanosensitive ion channel domain-containing protein [Thalassotalea insulae]GLX78867.1 mechanosensitive ion channel protein [Thalassotalea insulae]
MNLEKITQLMTDFAMQYGMSFILALLVLLIGWWVIGRILKAIDYSMDRAKIEVTLQRFLLSFIGIVLKAILLIIFASMVGVETASLIAMLGAAGLAVGLALQGSLSNLAGGVLILFFKPFKVGDVIEAQGHLGRVIEIQIFNTLITTLDNQRVYIPNGLLSNGCVKNIFAEPTRRVDMKFGVSYGDDIAQAKSVIREVLDANDQVLKEPLADVFISGHGASSIDITVRPWCQSDDYWEVYFATHEQLKVAFDKAGITIPFPQRDVHIIKED